jgi:hypothetical protein
MTSEDYWDEIESLAREVTREAREYQRDISEVLHETLGDHQWVVYYRFNPLVLAYSDNSAYGLSEGLISTKIRDHDEYQGQAAYWAMYADVQNHDNYDADPGEDDDTD